MPFGTRVHFGGSAVGVAVLVAVASPVVADGLPSPQVIATYTGPDDPADFAFVWDGRGSRVQAVGLGRWAVPAAHYDTAGLGREFRSFDTDPAAALEPGKVMTFTVRPADHPGGFGAAETDDGRADAARRAGYVRELLGRFYPNDGWAADPTAARAFQVAVWEVVGEDRFPEFDLFGGTFRADYPDLEAAPPFVLRAQEYLNALTGDDQPFRDQPALASQEVVQLVAATDSAGAGPVVFAVRRLGGPGVGSGEAAAAFSAGPGAIPAGLGSFGGGGLPGGFGGVGGGNGNGGQGGLGNGGLGNGGFGEPFDGTVGVEPLGGIGSGFPFAPAGGFPLDLQPAPFALQPAGPTAPTPARPPLGNDPTVTPPTPTNPPPAQSNLLPAAAPAPAGLVLAVVGVGTLLAGRAVAGRRKR